MNIKALIEEIEALPPEKLEKVYEYIQGLKRPDLEARNEAFRRLIAETNPEEIEELERAILEGCEKVDYEDW